MSRKKTQRKNRVRPRKPRPNKKVARRLTRARPWKAARQEPATEVIDPGAQRWTRLLTKADNDPESVLDDARCLTPYFVNRFFDLCDGKALEAPWVAPDYAEAALKLAEKIGEPHQINIAKGIGVHACIGNQEWDEAAELLEQFREDAFACCGVCTSDWLRRQGDLLVMTRDPRVSRAYLQLAANVLGEDLDDDARGRILFVRGIAHYFLRQRRQALDDGGEALRLLSLATPHGYFVDDIALIACFLQGTDERRYYQLAYQHLADFRERLKGHKQWNEVRERLRWVLALIDARMGHRRRARASLERIYTKHVKSWPHDYALAIATDAMLIYCLHLPEAHIRSIQSTLKRCKAELKLEPKIREHLHRAARTLGQQPRRVRQILVDLRRAFTVPVPGLLCDLTELTGQRAAK